MNKNEKKTVLKIIELKQEETLLKWLFRPFWVALTGTMIFTAFCHVLNGSFFIVAMLATIIAFGIYMSRKCHNRLKELKEFDLNPRHMK